MQRHKDVSFEGQVGLVTGAASGLGLAYSRLLAQRGARVVMHDVGAGLDGHGHDPHRIDATVALLRGTGLDVHAAHAAIDEREGCRALVADILMRHGRIDFIIHNAGWVEYQQIDVLEEGRFDHMMTIAAKAPLWLAEAAWPGRTKPMSLFSTVASTSSASSLGTTTSRAWAGVTTPPTVCTASCCTVPDLSLIHI